MIKSGNSKYGRIAAGAAVLFLAVLVAASAFLPGSAQGLILAEAELSPQFTILIDGTNKTFYNVNGEEVHPILFNGTTYLPVRAIGELMGKNVNWDEATLTVDIAGARTAPATTGTEDATAQKQTVNVELRRDFKIKVEGVQKSFADANGNVVYPMLYKGSTYLPLRAIGNFMGKNVSWDGATETVSLYGTLDTSVGTVTDADTFNSSTDVSPTPTAPATAGTAVTDIPTATANPAEGVNGTNQSIPNIKNASVSVEQAKSIALKHAGLDAASVSFVKVGLDYEKGRLIYEIEFYSQNKEYDYEIDATTGVVVSFDYDAEFYNPHQSAQSTLQGGQAITLEQAKTLALQNVPGASAANIVKAKHDYDDGRLSFDIEIILGTTEYEFEFDSATGIMTERSVSSIYD